jgi:hypothetical protein
MKSCVTSVSLVLAIVAEIAAAGVFAQQAPVKRNFEAEIRAALESAKTAARFEFLGILVRTWLLPQSGGEDTVTMCRTMSRIRQRAGRDTRYAEPARVFETGKK